MSELVEPLMKNITKDDWWEIWTSICMGLANVIEPGPIRDRLRKFELVDLDTRVPLEYPYYDMTRRNIWTNDFRIVTLKGLQDYIDDAVVIENKFGRITRVWWLLHSLSIGIECCGVDYEINIDFRDFETMFPQAVIEKRRDRCSCDETLELYWEVGGGCMDSGSPRTHNMCPYCYRGKGLIPPVRRPIIQFISKIREVFR